MEVIALKSVGNQMVLRCLSRRGWNEPTFEGMRARFLVCLLKCLGIGCLQHCTLQVWKGIMAQVERLQESSEGLPEEALTQIFQAGTFPYTIPNNHVSSPGTGWVTRPPYD
jgi:hypothetical protein